VVYIEDDPETTALVRIILTQHGFEVISAAGGQEGLETVRRETPDLVLLDLMMPDVDGWDVFHAMKADDRTRNIPVIVLTAKAQNIDMVLGLQIARVADYIAKPFDPQALVASVKRVLGEPADAG
jgi:DNA-binding response OmpR family regulator